MPVRRRAIVLVLDRLGTGFLGPYGNTWVETPAFNRLASRGVVVETVWSDSPALTNIYRSYWTGTPAFVSSAGADRAAAVSLVDELRLAQRGVTLLTDEPQLEPLVAAQESLESICLQTDASRIVGGPHEATTAPSVEETRLGKMFAAISERLAASDVPDLLWAHSQGLAGPWDAPLELRGQFADEGDPDPPSLVTPPSLILPANCDPDIPLGFAHAYAGQIVALDLCLDALLDELDQHPLRDEFLLIVTSPRGFPLGEHRVVGDAASALYGELSHVPLLLYAPGEPDFALRRELSLAQPYDLHAILRRWFELPAAAPGWARELLFPYDALPVRSLACAVGEHELTLRTPAWLWRRSPNGVELFVKPDDRWEVNNVANRCSPVVAGFETLAEQFQLAAARNEPFAVPNLPAELEWGVE